MSRVRTQPIVCGADVEVGNFIAGLRQSQGTCKEASSALLRQVDGVRAEPLFHRATCACEDCRRSRPPEEDPQDMGRKFLRGNGGCIYIDLNHLELCIPEVVSAWDHLAYWHAMLRIAEQALIAANREQPHGRKVNVLINNTDGLGHAYGSHLSFMISRATWNDIFRRKMHYLHFLASYQVSSIVFTGQGKVRSENGAPPVDYQISQRADFFEQVCAAQTTWARPIVNARDEALCGRTTAFAPTADSLARLHVIFYDSTLCHVTHLLKVGVMQIVLAMMETGRVDISCNLEDPLEALGAWSHDPDLEARARTCSGEDLTAVELQLRFAEAAQAFVEAGGCDGVVPRAREILALWVDTLEKLEARDFDRLAGRLDWVLKRSVLEQVLAEHAGLDWDHPKLKHLDHAFSSLDRDDGIYWSLEPDVVERVVSEDEIRHAIENPPEGTRAWARAMLLRRVPAYGIERIDWDRIDFLAGPGSTRSARTLDMPHPLGSGRPAAAQALGHPTLDDVVDALELTAHIPTDEMETEAS